MPVPLHRKNPYHINGDPFPTPPAFTKVLLRNINIPDPIWEPACGKGDMVRTLVLDNYQVFATDLYDCGYSSHATRDFLTAKLPSRSIKSIVTNPPYAMALEFALRGIHHMCNSGVRLVALLLPIHFMGSSLRYNELFTKHKPSKVIVISNRMKTEAGSSFNFNHAWFVWTHNPLSTHLVWDMAT